MRGGGGKTRGRGGIGGDVEVSSCANSREGAGVFGCREGGGGRTGAGGGDTAETGGGGGKEGGRTGGAGGALATGRGSARFDGGGGGGMARLGVSRTGAEGELFSGGFVGRLSLTVSRDPAPEPLGCGAARGGKVIRTVSFFGPFGSLMGRILS